MNFKKRELTNYIAVHCSATGPHMDIGKAEIDRWHRAKNWLAIGYHYVIKRDGTVEEGRPDDVVGAHVADFNSVSVGICMVGGVSKDDPNVPENNFTDEQFSSLQGLLVKLEEKYPDAIIQGHRDFPDVKKACPSFDVKDWMVSVGLMFTP